MQLEELSRAIAAGDFDRARTAALALGARAIRTLIRGLAAADARATVAEALLHDVAQVERERVVAALRSTAAGAETDRERVSALRMLNALDQPMGDATLRAPARVQQESARELAPKLRTAADIALAAQLLVAEVEADVVGVIIALAAAHPARARALVDELVVRADLAADVRHRLRAFASELPAPHPLRSPTGRAPKPTHFRHANGHEVILVETRGRWMAVLLDDAGTIADVLGDASLELPLEPAPIAGSPRELRNQLRRAGFSRIDADRAVARAVVGHGARAALRRGRRLPPAYYLGRDLLDLGAAHIAHDSADHDHAAALTHAIALLHQGAHPRAEPVLRRLLARTPADPHVHDALAACLGARGAFADAHTHYERAASLEPSWPTHAWNAGLTAIHAGDPIRGAHWFGLFMTQPTPAALRHDPAHDAQRLAARRFLATQPVRRLPRTRRAPGARRTARPDSQRR